MKKSHRALALGGYATSLLILILLLIFFHFRGVTYYDEGYILNSGLRIAHGQVPYRDFDMAYTPLSFLTVAAFLKVFGESVFVGRLVALVVSVVSLSALYQLLTLVTKKKLLILLCLLFFLAWGPAHINFPWPVMFAICFFFLTTLFYLQGIIRHNPIYFYSAGIIAVFGFFAKQNFGTALLFTSLLGFLFLERETKRRYARYFFLGIVSASFVAIVVLLSTASFLPFMQNLYLYTFKRIIVERSLDTPFLYEGQLVARAAKLVFYISPLLFSLVACFVSRHAKNKLFVIGLLTAVFYVTGIRPTTDYDHVVPLLAVSGVCLVIIIEYAKNAFITGVSLLLFLCLTLLGFYTAYFNGYYKWDIPLRDQTSFATHPRLRVSLSHETTLFSEELITYIDTHTATGQYIFVYDYAPLVYFISDRSNATRYDLPLDLPPSEQIDAIQDLQRKRVRLVIMNTATKNEKSLVATYINKHYHLARSIGGFLVFTKER